MIRGPPGPARLLRHPILLTPNRPDGLPGVCRTTDPSLWRRCAEMGLASDDQRQKLKGIGY